MIWSRLLLRLSVLSFAAGMTSSCAQNEAWEKYIAAGDAQFKQKHYADAQKSFDLARNECKNSGAQDPRLVTTLNKLGAAYYKEGKYADAENFYKQAWAIREKAQPPDAAGVAESLDNLGKVYERQSRSGYYDDDKNKLAEAQFQRALSMQEKALGANDKAVAETLNDLADLYIGRNSDEKAEPLYRRALAIREKTLPANDPATAATLNSLGEIVYREGLGSGPKGKFKEAESLFKRALSIENVELAADDPDKATTLNNLGWAEEQLGNSKDAEPLYKQALAIEEKNPDRDGLPPKSLNNLINLYDEDDTHSLLKPSVFAGYQYVPEVHKDSLKGFKLLKDGKIILKEALDHDYPYEYANISIAFPLSKARLANSFHVNGEIDNIDITGDVTSRLPPINNLVSAPNPGLIVGTFSGGMNSCCTDYQLFSLARKATKLPSLEGYGVYSFRFGDFHGNGHLQALGHDMTFCYWNASMAGSPRPAVVLNYTPAGWTLSLDDMRIPSIPADQIARAVARCKKSQTDGEKFSPPEEGTFNFEIEVWSTMLNLIYAGHADEAWKFLDQLWPEGKRANSVSNENGGGEMNKQEFVKSFKEQLRKSPYWKELVLLNKGQTL